MLSYQGCPCSGSFFLVKTCSNSFFSHFITVIFVVFNVCSIQDMGRSIKVSVSGFPCRATLSIFLYGEHTRVQKFGQIVGISCLNRPAFLRNKYLVSPGFLSFEVLCLDCPFAEVILSLISGYFLFIYYQVLKVTLRL